MKTVDKILTQLHDQVLHLLDDILSICPNEPDILLIRLFFENQIDSVELMDEFLKWVYPWKEHILQRNKKYFEENDHMFGPLPPEKVAYFKEKIRDGTFDEEDLSVIWDYLSVFISLMDQYNKVK